MKDENRDRCLLEGVRCLGKSAPKDPVAHTDSVLNGVVSFFTSNNLALVQADKEGECVVLPKGIQ